MEDPKGEATEENSKSPEDKEVNNAEVNNPPVKLDNDDDDHDEEDKAKEEGDEKQITEPVNEEKEEAMAYINFKQKFKEDKNIYGKWYIINKDWINKWKYKINYDALKHPYRQTIITEFTSEPLPKISNDNLLVDPSSYLRLKEDNMIIIHPDHQRDLKIVNETIWKLLVNKYQGGPEIKFEIKEGASQDQVPDFQYLKLNFVILPLRSDFSTNDTTTENKADTKTEAEANPNTVTEEGNGIDTVADAESNTNGNGNGNSNSISNDIELKQYTIYTIERPTIRSIKERIVNIIKEHNLLGPNLNSDQDPDLDLLSNDHLRLYTLQNKISSSFLQSKLNSTKADLSKPDSLLDPIDFNLNLIEMFLDKHYQELFHRDNITFCLERSTPTSPFLFKVSDKKMGNCEYDSTYNMLTVSCKCKQVWYCNELCLQRDIPYHQPKCTKSIDFDDANHLKANRQSSAEGLCGLSNLGNTCFMNTSLQCLSNCFPLTEYFISDKYKKDLNEDNPLGSKGLLANVYAHFLKNLWYGDSSVFTPNYFKQALGNYLKMFSGFQQHDTQEFLNYLLDVLHEDLNRVLKKPIVELDDFDMPDEVKSKSHWIAFQKRNQSVLVDLFYGQFKSTLTCPMDECKNISITFDPFLSISLPLVCKVQAFSINCFFIFHDVTLSPLFFEIPFYKDAPFMALRNKIGQMLNIHPWSFIITNISRQQSIQELIPDTKPLHTLMSSDRIKYFIFQIDPAVFYSNVNVVLKDEEEMKQYEKEFNKDSKEYSESRRSIIANIYSDRYEEDCSDKMDGDDIEDKDKERLKKNYGLNEDMMPTILQFMDKVSDYIVFPRPVCLNKKSSIKDVYYYVYKTYYSVMIHPKEQPKRGNHYYHHPLSNSPERDEEEGKGKNKDGDGGNDSLAAFEGLFKDIKDEESFNEAFENNSIPFYIVYLPKNRSYKRERLYYFNNANDTNANDNDNTNTAPIETNTEGVEVESSTKEEEDVNDNIKVNINANTDTNVNTQTNTNEVILNTTLEPYITKFNKEPDTLMFSNKIFTLGIVWNRKLSQNSSSLQEYAEPSIPLQPKSNKAINIYECFDRFSKEEVLEENNEWYCPKCKQHRRAKKKIELYRIPKFLIIHLKRFNNKSKLDAVVDFPIKDLDIAKYVISDDKDTKFDLVAIANHYGSMGFGHYIAYAKNYKKDKWYEFDDSRVSSRDEDDLVSSSAYVLFYSKKSNSEVDWNEIYNRGFVNYEEVNNVTTSETTTTPTTNTETTTTTTTTTEPTNSIEATNTDTTDA